MDKKRRDNNEKVFIQSWFGFVFAGDVWKRITWDACCKWGSSF